MSDFTSKSCGDMIVCGVSADEVIEDLGRIVPKSVATHITAQNAHRSKDLWRLLSQSRLIRLNVNPLLRLPSTNATASVGDGVEALQEEYSKAASDVIRLKADLASVSAEVITLRIDLSRANSEIERLKGETNQGSKLDDILAILKERPTMTITQAGSATHTSPSSVGDDIPMYIPSQIKSDANESRVAVKEESTSSTSLSDASRALREKRKKQE